MTAGAKTVTILFTDLVGSTELLQRAGDEQAQRIFKAHHRLLSEAVQQHGGDEVKWLGDGLMVAFDSAQDAVRCAIAMQQSSRRPAAGERLEIRAGLNVGEALLEESDYFGTPVVVARRLCDSADAGQIFASDIVVRLLDGRGDDVSVNELGPMELKGITGSVPAVEIVYEHDPMALLRKLPFVGRQAEYETMLAKLAEAQSGRGSVILLAGEPGIGKTRLTEEVCDHAAAAATVVRGNCYEGDVAAPFGPWLEALRSLADQLSDADLRATLGPGAPDVAVLIPEVRRRLPDLEEPPKLDPESERARLFESVAAWLRNTAEQRPLVVFLDDLQWSDKPSLALMEYVARGTFGQRIVMVGTYRDMEVDRVHPLSQTLAALRRLEHHDRIALHGMPREEVDHLLESIEPSEESRPIRRVLSAVLYRETEGNPLFIWEVITHLIETGKIVHEGGRWTSHVENVADLGIPEGVREAIGRRLSRLSEGCNRILQRASALTGGFSWDELTAICDETEDDLLDALDEALGSQLIEERGHLTYAFTHALVRATLYEELSAPRRVQLHRRVAEALESLYAENLDDHLGELAAHYMASTGGEAQKAIEYSIRAGSRAKDLLAWEDGVAHYMRALEALDAAGAPADEERCTILLELAECNHFSGRFEPSLDHLREAAAIARSLASATIFARTALSFEEAAQKGESDLAAERVVLMDEALEMLEEEDSSQRATVLAYRVEAAASLANSQAGISPIGFTAWAGLKDDATLAQAREAVEMAERLGDDRALAATAFFLHSYSWGPDNLQERLSLSERGIAAAARAGEGRKQIELLQTLAGNLLESGDIEGSERSIEEYSALTERLRYRGDYYIPAASRAMLAIVRGDLESGEQLIQGYAAVETGNPTAAITYVAQLFMVRHMQGRLAELDEMWSGVVSQWTGLPVMPAGLIIIKLAAGDEAAARELIRRFSADGIENIPRDLIWQITLALIGEGCAEIGEQRVAADLYELLLPYKSSTTVVGITVNFGPLVRTLARLAASLERWDEAEEHFGEALASNDRQGFHAWTAWTRLNYGDMLLRRASTSSARGDERERAVALLNEALAFAKEAGMGGVQRDAEALLQDA